MKTSLRFINDDFLRFAIERDLNELEVCLTAGAYKAAMVLAGSIVEAVLVDHYLSFPRKIDEQNKILSMSLSSLIDWAEDDQIISKTTKVLSVVIKSYRNLIHPGRELRLAETIDMNSARVAESLVHMILSDLTNRTIKIRGITANEFINKLMIDSISPSLIIHLLKSMSKVERMKLLNLLPAASVKDPQFNRSYLKNAKLCSKTPRSDEHGPDRRTMEPHKTAYS